MCAQPFDKDVLVLNDDGLLFLFWQFSDWTLSHLQPRRAMTSNWEENNEVTLHRQKQSYCQVWILVNGRYDHHGTIQLSQTSHHSSTHQTTCTDRWECHRLKACSLPTWYYYWSHNCYVCSVLLKFSPSARKTRHRTVESLWTKMCKFVQKIHTDIFVKVQTCVRLFGKKELHSTNPTGTQRNSSLVPLRKIQSMFNNGNTQGTHFVT